MCVLERDDGRFSLNFAVETMDVEKRSDIRESEQLKMKAAKRFLESMSSEAFDVVFQPQFKRDDVVTMITQLLASQGHLIRGLRALGGSKIRGESLLSPRDYTVTKGYRGIDAHGGR